MTYTTAPQPESASLSIPDSKHCDTVSNSCSGPCTHHLVIAASAIVLAWMIQVQRLWHLNQLYTSFLAFCLWLRTSHP